LVVTLACSAVSLSAAQPTDPPPRGFAYGYYWKNGVHIQLTYMEDGSRTIELSNCRPRNKYLIEASEDLVTWNPLVILRAERDGTATLLDTTPLPYCFYRATRVR
jgi:hypothetical protein